MSLASGMAAQIGYADETTVGTPVAPTDFVPLVSESLSLQKERLESEAIIAGRRVITSDQWNGGNDTVEGSIQHELMNRGLGKLFKHMFGSVNTTGAGPYVHTFTPGDLSATKSMTVQVGRPGVNGTVTAFNYAGCKVASWEIACSAGEIATLGIDVIGMKEVIGTPALGSPTYPSGIKPLKFNHGSVMVAGSLVNVKSITVSGENGLADDRRFLGSQMISEPLENELRVYEGSMELEWSDTSLYTAYTAGTESAVVLNFTAGTDEVDITMNTRFDGETPQVGGREILTHNVPFKVIGTTSDALGITATLTNSDATV